METVRPVRAVGAGPLVVVPEATRTGRWTVSSRRVPILIIAVVIAAMTAMATFKYASNADERALGDAEPVAVFLVKKDIPKGFSGARALDEGYIAKEEIPRKFYPANAVVDPQTLRGKVAIAGLAAGLPVVQTAFADPQVARESFADLIDKGMQAVTLSVSDVQARRPAGGPR